ncbi:MAG: HAMP domain-containing histidine kinase [Calditrichaeota bacterium]|nr:HAMP domain-containing histidine kinase [Calditrichota bacterium]
MSNALSRWALAIASLVFLMLLARRLGTQETLLRQVLQPGNRAVGIFDGSLRLVYENSAFAEELSDPARVASLLSLADGSQPAPLRLEDGLRRMIWHRRLHVRSRGRKPWTILEGEDLSLERENEQQRLFLMKLAVMAHDLKAPLTPIRLQAEGIEDALPMLPPEVAGRVRHALGEIDRQVERSLQLITRFMGMARTEFELSPVSLPDIARAAMNELESMGWPELDTRLVYDSSVSHVAEAEGDVLQLALFELLLNAAQSMEGQVSLLLTLSSGHEGSTLRVEDNGPGIPEADLARVLEPGYTTRAKGTGFGLYFVKRVLERMGGDLLLSNSGAGGLTAIVTFKGQSSARS